ncbi:diguanylate cyclase domain-containing protein [Deinococcus humi]|uniref:Diguanylate cyclase (GGDEF)-like protein n=1 Tax=Deinococcus humi TaxID=662880 RepID=A0A7W8JRY6_9DEIO|nr:diguanylate cyclase [Deinococcus humi]MBB5361840.1 diguanylate cyclase (GGDEF)-like protein [Deinococcus humi]GGO23384.1 hypothetical protein GCM10008949_11550 [Deinococcus humi]
MTEDGATGALPEFRSDAAENVDDLTGLPMRQAFFQQLEALCARGRGSLLLCDLDYLKLLNDTLGHPAGDAALTDVAGSLRDRLHPGWQAYRLGGDEFAVLAPVDAARLGGWATAAMAALAARPGHPLRLSGGLAGVTPESTPQCLLAGADRRLYAAKRRGRGRLVDDDEDSAQTGQHHRLLERDEALGQLTTYLQAALSDSHDAAAVEVRSGPGGGLSAFLQVADRAAQLLGYRTLHIQGNRSRRLRQYGAWSTATLDGHPVNGPAASSLGPADLAVGEDKPWQLPETLPPSDRPLALLLDRAEDFDPHTLEAIGPLRAAARICVLGRVLPPRGPLATAGDDPVCPAIELRPLSEGAVGMVGGLLCGAPLAGPVQTWLAHRSRGVPAEIGRWLGALLLEARLRHEDPLRLVEGELERAGLDRASLARAGAGDTESDGAAAEGDWQWSAARHLTRPPSYNRPYLWGHCGLFQKAAYALQRGAVVVLTGPAGRGRTRLAEQLLMEAGRDVPGGAWAVSLAGIGRTEELLSRLAQTLLGQPADLGGLESVGRVLARQPVLLLLDDLPPGVGSAALERLLSFAPDTRVIVTAPHPLGLRGEQVLALPLLEPEVVRGALHACAPTLAVGLVGRGAEWVRGDPARLQDALRLLTIDPSGGLLEGLLSRPAPRSGWAGGLPLGAVERNALAALRLFGDLFSLPWAQSVTGASPLMLAGLSQHGYLVSVGQGLYRLAGGLDQNVWDTDHPDAAPLSPAMRPARRRALTALDRALTRLGPVQHCEWLTQLDTVYVPLRSLLTGLLRRGVPETGPEPALVNAVVALNAYRISRTYFLDARADLELVLRSTVHAPAPSEPRSARLAPSQLAEVRLALARVLQHLGEYARASELTAAVQDDLRLAARQHAGALLVRGRILHRRSEYAAALEAYGQAEVLLKRSRVARRAPELLALALGGQARSLIYLDRLPQARSLNTRGLAMLGMTHGPLTRALLLNTAALIDMEDRRLEAAEAGLRSALRLHEEHGDREGQILNRMGLTWVRLLRREGEDSVRLGRELLREAQDAAQVWEIANILLNLGHAEHLCGRVEMARAHYLEAGELVDDHDAPSLHAELLGGLAACAHAQGDHAEARRLLSRALGHPGANAEVRRFFAPLQSVLEQDHPPARNGGVALDSVVV